MKKRLLMLVLCGVSFSLFSMSNEALLEQAAARNREVVMRGRTLVEPAKAPKLLTMQRDAVDANEGYLLPPYEPTCGNEVERYCILGTSTALSWLCGAFGKLTATREKRD